jgi:hypothetical protein
LPLLREVTVDDLPPNLALEPTPRVRAIMRPRGALNAKPLGRCRKCSMRIRGLEELDGHLLDGLTFVPCAYAAFDRIRARDSGIEELRMRRTPRSKKLIEEILPLATVRPSGGIAQGSG